MRPIPALLLSCIGCAPQIAPAPAVVIDGPAAPRWTEVAPTPPPTASASSDSCPEGAVIGQPAPSIDGVLVSGETRAAGSSKPGGGVRVGFGGCE